MPHAFRVSGVDVVLRPFCHDDAAELLRIQIQHRQSFAPYVPLRSETFFTAEGQHLQIDADLERWQTDQGYAYAITQERRLIGRVALSNVVRGAWRSATLGYWVDPEYQGKGYATQAVQGILWAAFEGLDLHRVQAAVMPKNTPSIRVVQKAGFVCEGYAPYYLNINGQWQDHKVFSCTQELWDGAPGFSLHKIGL